MGVTVTIEGHGRIEWGYHVAAELREFVIEHDRPADVWTFGGTAVVANRYQLSQRPLELVVPTARGEWRYRVLATEVVGTRIRGIVVPIRRAAAGPPPPRREGILEV
jgi:hypothetical protein